MPARSIPFRSLPEGPRRNDAHLGFDKMLWLQHPSVLKYAVAENKNLRHHIAHLVERYCKVRHLSQETWNCILAPFLAVSQMTPEDIQEEGHFNLLKLTDAMLNDLYENLPTWHTALVRGS